MAPEGLGTNDRLARSPAPGARRSAAAATGHSARGRTVLHADGTASDEIGAAAGRVAAMVEGIGVLAHMASPLGSPW